MNMTHYMGLLAENQPWNLIIFMAIPVILAESLVATEFLVVFGRLTTGGVRALNKYLGIILGVYFTGIFVRMVTGIIPTITWNTWVDVVAVWAYALGFVPVALVALMEFGLLWKKRSDAEKMKIHFILVTIFLVLAHVAMIFGMVDPSIIGGGAPAHMNM